MMFFVGVHDPHMAAHVGPCMVSVNRLRRRVSDFGVGDWLMDSGAFTEVTKHGGFRWGPDEYAAQVDRWSECGNLLAAATQDWMCEPFALQATGLTIQRHQLLTVERFDAIREHLTTPTHIMPVLQGWHPADYVRHAEMYGDRLGESEWVGVGSVCKRNTDVGSVAAVLSAIKTIRPDLRLHGFGLKTTALADSRVRDLLYSADSMAWSYSARMNGRDGNCWREARRFASKINRQAVQTWMF